MKDERAEAGERGDRRSPAAHQPPSQQRERQNPEPGHGRGEYLKDRQAIPQVGEGE